MFSELNVGDEVFVVNNDRGDKYTYQSEIIHKGRKYIRIKLLAHPSFKFDISTGRQVSEYGVGSYSIYPSEVYYNERQKFNETKAWLSKVLAKHIDKLNEGQVNDLYDVIKALLIRYGVEDGSEK